MDKEIARLLALVEAQIRRKAKLYDGAGSVGGVGTSGPDAIGHFMFSVIEEAGEVSSALTRHRYELARAECIDVCHSALLLYLAIECMEENNSDLQTGTST